MTDLLVQLAHQLVCVVFPDLALVIKLSLNFVKQVVELVEVPLLSLFS